MARDLLRVLRLWRSRTGWLALGGATAAGSALLGLALLLLAGQGVVNTATPGGIAAASALGGGAALLLLRPLVLLRPAARWAERMVSHAATFRALADLRIWFFRRLAERMPAGIGGRSSGDLLGRLVSDVEALDALYLRAILPAVAALAAVLAAALALVGEPALAALACLPLVLALLLPLALAPAAAGGANEAALAQGRLRAAAVDPLVGLEDTLAANAEARAGAALEREAAALDRGRRAVARRGALGGAAGTLLVQASLLGAVAWGLAAEGAGAAPGGGRGVPARGDRGADGRPPARGRRPGRCRRRRPPAVRRRGHAGPGGRAAAGELRRTAGGPRRPLRGRRVRLVGGPPAGFRGFGFGGAGRRRLVVLGASGSGKSSLAALLLKLAAPRAGRLTLGGVDIASLPAEAVRRRVACLTQDARLFDDSIAANLRVAAPGAPDAALWRALDRAGIGELVRALPDGLNTGCGEGGARFSGGQARRLALARVLLSAAPVLVLDEPTAGLDAAAERAFLETLEEATAGRTVVLLAHRLTGAERPTRVLRWPGGGRCRPPGSAGALFGCRGGRKCSRDGACLSATPSRATSRPSPPSTPTTCCTAPAPSKRSRRARPRWRAASRGAGPGLALAGGGGDGQILGFAYLAQFRPRSAYRHAGEDSVYVRDDIRGRASARRWSRRCCGGARSAGSARSSR
jgi:ATP-binding cassette subfamily C protein CydC